MRLKAEELSRRHGDTCAQLPDEGTEAIDIRGLAGLLTGQEDSWAEPVVEAVPARAAAHRVTRLLPLSRRKREIIKYCSLKNGRKKFDQKLGSDIDFAG